MKVKLKGGPFDGIEVELPGRSVQATGEGVPDGHVARYTPTLDRKVLQFRGFAKVIATIPAPGKRGRVN